MIVKTLDNGTVEFIPMGAEHEIITRSPEGATTSTVRLPRHRALALAEDMEILLRSVSA